MSVPDPAAVDWVPISNAVPPVVEGQWLQGQGGAAVWAPIGAVDVGGAALVDLISPGWRGGPWPADWTITLKKKSNVLLAMTASMFAGVIGVNGIACKWDGNVLPVYGDYFFNEANSHKLLTTYNTVVGQAAGNHTITLWLPYGNAASDGNDRAIWAATIVAIP